MLKIELSSEQYKRFMKAYRWAESMPMLGMAYLIGWTKENIGIREADILCQGIKLGEKVNVVDLSEQASDCEISGT